MLIKGIDVQRGVTVSTEREFCMVDRQWQHHGNSDTVTGGQGEAIPRDSDTSITTISHTYLMWIAHIGAIIQG